jgi:hypothetical protein
MEEGGSATGGGQDDDEEMDEEMEEGGSATGGGQDDDEEMEEEMEAWEKRRKERDEGRRAPRGRDPSPSTPSDSIVQRPTRRAVVGPCTMTTDATEELKETLQGVQVLELDTIRFKSADAFEETMQILETLPTLEKVVIRGCGRSISGDDARGAQRLTRVLSTGFSTLTCINIIECDLCEQGVYYIAKGLEANLNIVSINLSGNAMDTSIRHIADALIAFPRPLIAFHMLEVSSIFEGHPFMEKKIGEANEHVLDALLQCVGTGKSLTELSLGYEEGQFLRYTSTTKLVQLLNASGNLHTLQVSGVPLQMPMICQAIAMRTSLTSLSVVDDLRSAFLGLNPSLFTGGTPKGELAMVTRILRANHGISKLSMQQKLSALNSDFVDFWDMLRYNPRGLQPLEFLKGNAQMDCNMNQHGNECLCRADLRLVGDASVDSSYAALALTNLWREKYVAFAMGAHSRLGGESGLLQRIDEPVIRMILTNLTEGWNPVQRVGTHDFLA